MGILAQVASGFPASWYFSSQRAHSSISPMLLTLTLSSLKKTFTQKYLTFSHSGIHKLQMQSMKRIPDFSWP